MINKIENEVYYEIYSKEDCKLCTEKIKELESQGHNYVIYTLGIDFEREDFKEKFPDNKFYPGVVKVEIKKTFLKGK